MAPIMPLAWVLLISEHRDRSIRHPPDKKDPAAIATPSAVRVVCIFGVMFKEYEE